MATWELYARGRVQGVGFRWFVQQLAFEHGVCGYVCNLADGSVKIIAEADEYALEGFQMAISCGPHHGRVDDLEVNKLESAKKYHDFEIK
ncbi:MAG: acylphosphatase [Candidatus Cloacimonas sp.]|jgi:acylphosphatase|nr:acylphosphatase [Candidatus Cloacimonas sp.]